MVFLMDSSQHKVVFLLLSLFYGAFYVPGQAEEISVTQTVKATLGDDVVLPCHMDPPINAFSMTVEWGRPDLSPRFVFIWYKGKELLTDQNQAYSGRTSMSTDKLKTGDLSLTLSSVKTSDNGTYRCWIPTMDEEYIVDLLVGASSSPAISLVGHDKVSSGVMIDCESKGLYPEPEVLWLDSKGDVLSSDQKKSVKGPDGLFNVSSRVTVTRRHNNVFTCKLQQKSINWTSETHIHVPDDFFVVPSSSITSTVFAVLFGLMLLAASGLLVWQWKKQKTEKKQPNKKTEDQALMDSEKKKTQLEEELEKKEEEQEETTNILKTLTSLSDELKTQQKKCDLMRETTQKNAELRKDKINSLHHKISKQLFAKRDKILQQLEEILQKDNCNKEEMEERIQKLNKDTEKLITMTLNDINVITKKQGKVENQVAQIKKQIEDTTNQSEGKQN